jgi:hypothetical protein
MGGTDILMALAKNHGAYLYGEVDVSLRYDDGSIMKTTDDYGREVNAVFPYEILDDLLRQHYVKQDPHDARVYRISFDGLKVSRQ